MTKISNQMCDILAQLQSRLDNLVFSQRYYYVYDPITGLWDRLVTQVLYYRISKIIPEIPGISPKAIASTTYKKDILQHLTELCTDHGFSAKLDSNPYLLPIQNKQVIDLRTGQVRELTLTDYCRRCCPVIYDPEADIQPLENFFREIMDDDVEAVEKLQRILGYCLSGEVDPLNRGFYFVGQGSNGKSTVVRLLRRLLDNYASRLIIDPANEISDYPGKQIITLNEDPDVPISGFSIITFPVQFVSNPLYQGQRKIKFYIEQELDKHRSGLLKWLIAGSVAYFLHGWEN